MSFDFNYQPDGERKTREGDQDGRETMMREAAEGEDTSRRSFQTMIEDPSMVTIIQDHHQGTETFRTYSQSPHILEKFIIVSNALMITFLFRTGSTSHNMSSMSSHNMSGDMYARFPQRNEKKLKLNSPFNIRMIAEQTAAYQKQMWLSQLQVTNPQAYQVPYSPHSTYLSDS